MRRKIIYVISYILKQRSNKDSFVEVHCVTYEDNEYIQEKNCLRYEFINLGDVPVYVNNLLLEPIRIGAGLNSFYRWESQVKQGEFDVTKYYIHF